MGSLFFFILFSQSPLGLFHRHPCFLWTDKSQQAAENILMDRPADGAAAAVRRDSNSASSLPPFFSHLMTVCASFANSSRPT